MKMNMIFVVCSVLAALVCTEAEVINKNPNIYCSRNLANVVDLLCSLLDQTQEKPVSNERTYDDDSSTYQWSSSETDVSEEYNYYTYDTIDVDIYDYDDYNKFLETLRQLVTSRDGIDSTEMTNESLNPTKKSTTGSVEECCYKFCSIGDLLTYC